VLVEYFDNPQFTKIKNVDEEFSVYMCRLNSQLGSEIRYLVCIVGRDAYLVGDEVSLKALPWTVFQTRSLTDIHDIKRCGYQPKSRAPFNAIIKRTSKNDKEVEYSCDAFPVTISLLVRPTDMFDYPAEGRLNSALETFNTIIMLRT